MCKRLATAAAIIMAATGVVGCQSTPHSQVVRQESRDRIDLVNAQVSYDQAERAYETGQFDKALNEVNKAITRYDDAAHFHVLMGRIYIETHRLERAIECFMIAMEKNAECAEAHYFAGIVFERWSDDEEAYEHYRTAFEIDSTNAQFLLAAAESLIALGEFEGADALVREKISYFEHNAALQQLLGQLALIQGDPVTAAAHYREARLLSDGGDEILQEELAWAQFEAGDFEGALETVTDLVERQEPGNERADLVHLQARCLAAAGRSIEARNLYLKLTELRPADPDVWIALGLLARELGDFRRVAMCGVRVIALAPTRFEGYLLKGMNERHHGNITEAIKLFRAAAHYSGDSAAPHMILGQCLEEIGDMDGAMAAYAAAQNAEPEHAGAHSMMLRVTQSPELDRPE